MKPVAPVIPELAHLEMRFGENQPEYDPLPGLVLDGPDRQVVTRWQLDDEDRARLAAGGSIYLSMLTFGQPLQPVLLTTEPPELHVLHPDGIRTVGGDR